MGNYTVSNDLPASLELEKKDVVPAKLLSWRDKFDAGKHTREWLVQWEGMDIGDATWEEELLLKSQFPDFSLEDKAVVAGGGDDRSGSVSSEGEVLVNKKNVEPKIWRVYERRIKKGVTKKV